ncbi:DUF6457 domain-containing protein [Miniimonas sp. S16]|uniref:DUF6457 domain-containing protein n=1 Tax=Miniimonas sp. S16 TaxID=2171623 RepID=UPI000D525E69|nr:DUF6457 domain-containing protein [Miniimonas sp. S16]
MSNQHLPPDALDDWLAGVSDLYGLGGVTTAETTVVLDVARDVSRGVARPAAPLTTYLLGLAVGQAVAAGEDVGAATARLAREVTDLALARPEAGASDPGTPDGERP